MLRDEGGLEYKASIADTIIAIVEDNPDAKEAGLTHLCEFIEDCEHTSLAVRILHLLGRGTAYQATFQVHSVHLQSRHIGERGCEGSCRFSSRSLWCHL